MDIGVEISLYPLHQQFIPPIEDFIARLNRGRRVAGGDQQHEHAGVR